MKRRKPKIVFGELVGHEEKVMAPTKYAEMARPLNLVIKKWKSRATKKRHRLLKGWKYKEGKPDAYWDPKALKELTRRHKPKKPVLLTLEQRIHKINNAIYRLGDNEDALNEIKDFLLSRILELPIIRMYQNRLMKEIKTESIWNKLGKRKKWSCK